MFPKTTRVSAFDYNAHRFQRALKELKNAGIEPLDAFSKLKSQYTKATVDASKAVLAFTVVAIASIIGSESGSIDIRTALFDLSIPKSYAYFSASWLWVSLVLRIQGISQFLAYLSVFKKKFDNTRHDFEMQIFIKDVSIDDYVAPPIFDRFLAPQRWTYVSRITFFIATMVSGLIPALAAWWTLLLGSFFGIFAEPNAPFGNLISLASLVLLVFPTAFLLLGFVKTRPIRQVNLVRWTFLFPLMKDEHGFHPQVDEWLQKRRPDEEKQDKPHS